MHFHVLSPTLTTLPFSFLSPLQKSKKDVLNFDTEFTKEEPTLTPVNADLVNTINQAEFSGFSFFNTEFGKLGSSAGGGGGSAQALKKH